MPFLMVPGSKHDSLGFSENPDRWTDRESEKGGEGNSLVTYEQDRGSQDAQSISLHV